MIFTTSSNIIDIIACKIENKFYELENKKWQSGNYSCTCHVCHKTLYSKIDKYSPINCGWMRLKKRIIYNPWICHQCLEHHDSHWIKAEE